MRITFRQWATMQGEIGVPSCEKKTLEGDTPVADDGFTLLVPPDETRRERQPCQWVGSEWVLVTSGDAYDTWASNKAIEELSEIDDIDPNGKVSRMVEDLYKHVIKGDTMSAETIARHDGFIASKNEKRAKIKK